MSMYLQVVATIAAAAALAVSVVVFIMGRQLQVVPNLKVRFENGKSNAKYGADIDVTLAFYIENVGTWLAKPAASEARIWINFPNNFCLKEARSDAGKCQEVNQSVGGLCNGMVHIGIGGQINIFPKEKRYIYVNVKTPKERGTYPILIPILLERGDAGIKKLKIKIV